jgi:hypothetical protein
MALEDAVNRLASVIQSQGEASAVAELIRQRDAANKSLESVTENRNWYRVRNDEIWDEKRKLDRRITALKGVITRMKNKKVPL